jgi:CheY-like chemotaxis protein
LHYQAYIEAGADAVLSKPFTADELRAALAEASSYRSRLSPTQAHPVEEQAHSPTAAL